MMVNGEGKLVGRVGSLVAKELIKGYQVCLYNAEKLIISGSKTNLLEKYVTRRRLKNHANPEHSPKWPNVPYLLTKRIIRGMLPWKSRRGREAFKRLRVYNGKPHGDHKGREIAFETAVPKKYITMLALCRSIGYGKKESS